MYCFCGESSRFSGGYLATPCADVIEISLKFEKTHNDANSSICNNSIEKCNLNFLELSHKSLDEVCSNVQVHDCVSELLHHVLIKKPHVEETNTSPIDSDKSPPTIITLKTTTDVTVHQPETEIQVNDLKNELKIAKRNSSLRSSMKSAHSMETILEKNSTRLKDKSPDESKAKSVSHLNDAEDEDEFVDIENGESIELIFISDEFVNKLQKQEQEVIIVDDKDGKRRESLTNRNKIVIITDEYKQKVLRNNSIVVTKERKSSKKKVKTTVNTNSNSYLQYDEPFDKEMESKNVAP
jgi:hypothetical protein